MIDTIRNIIRYPNLDTDSIDNDTLRWFYNQCLNH